MYLCLQDQRERTYSTVKTRATSASVNNLKPGTVYVFQIRAFTAAGYGNYSPRLDVATLEEATGNTYLHFLAINITKETQNV